MSGWERFIREVFTIEGRIGQRRYLICLLKCGCPFLISWVLSFASPTVTNNQLSNLDTVLLFMISMAYFLFILCAILLTVRRLHDMGKNGWWSLFLLASLFNNLSPVFMPIFVSLCLACMKGTEGRNKYGEPPPDD